MRAPSASRAIRQARSSASTSRASTRRKTVSQDCRPGRLRQRPARDGLSKKAGVSARTGRVCGRTSLSTRFGMAESSLDLPKSPATSANNARPETHCDGARSVSVFSSRVSRITPSTCLTLRARWQVGIAAHSALRATPRTKSSGSTSRDSTHRRIWPVRTGRLARSQGRHPHVGARCHRSAL